MFLFMKIAFWMALSPRIDDKNDECTTVAILIENRMNFRKVNEPTKHDAS